MDLEVDQRRTLTEMGPWDQWTVIDVTRELVSELGVD